MTPQVDSKEFFTARQWLAGPTDDFEPPGVKASLLVPRSALTRHLWIACGASYQFEKSDHWFVQGRLKFYLEDTQVGVLEFSDASSELLAAERAKGLRAVMRVAPDGNGSTQPSLRYQETDTPKPLYTIPSDGGTGYLIVVAAERTCPERGNIRTPANMGIPKIFIRRTFLRTRTFALRFLGLASGQPR